MGKPTLDDAASLVEEEVPVVTEEQATASVVPAVSVGLGASNRLSDTPNYSHYPDHVRKLLEETNAKAAAAHANKEL